MEERHVALFDLRPDTRDGVCALLAAHLLFKGWGGDLSTDCS